MTEQDHSENFDFDIPEDEIAEERGDYDLMSRLVSRPKRKPEVVTLYLDEAAGEELGYARDVDVENEFGIVVRTERLRSGVIGELDAARSMETPDEKLVKSLAARAKKLAEQIESNSLTLTLEWIPKLVEETVQAKAKRSVGVKQGAVPDTIKERYIKAWLSRMISAAAVSFVDNLDGTMKPGLSVKEAELLRRQLPGDQYDKIDKAIGRLQGRAAFSQEALDSADF